jgi:UDP-glucose 4-epimerase
VYAAAIPRFVDAALNNRPIRIFGDGEQTRDFCYVDNAVAANLLAASCPRKLTGEVVNIAGGRRVSLNALCTEIARVLDRRVEVEHGPSRVGDVLHSLADISRAKDLIGYEPLIRWEEGIEPTIQFLEALRSSGLAAATRRVAAARSGRPLVRGQRTSRP